MAFVHTTNYIIDRKQAFNGRTTPTVTWQVKDMRNGKLLQVTKTLKAARQWVQTYNGIDAINAREGLV